MSRTRIRKGESQRITLRFEPEELAYYGSRAREHGISTSAFIRQTLHAGMIAESAIDIEERMTALSQKFNTNAPTSAIPDRLLLSILISENLLTKIVESRDPQELYAAQDKAKRQLQKLRDGGA